MLRGVDKIDAFWIALIGAAVGLWYSRCRGASWTRFGDSTRHEMFTGMLVYDSFTVYFRMLLLFFAVLFVIFTQISGIPDRDDAPDFYSLVLGATLGMCLMASANHLLTIFLGVEMASVPSYALAGMLKGRRAQQRSGAEVRRLRRRRGWHHALWHQPAGRRAGQLPFADDGRAAGRPDFAAANWPIARMVLALGGLMIIVGWRSSSRPCRSISGAPTCSKGPRPRSTRF